MMLYLPYSNLFYPTYLLSTGVALKKQSLSTIEFNFVFPVPLSHLEWPTIYNLAKYNIIQHHTTSYNIIQHHTTSYNIIHCHTTSYNIIRRHTTSYNILQHHTTSYDVIRRHTTSYDVIQRRVHGSSSLYYSGRFRAGDLLRLVGL